jgi:HJR/Mrr/RecB family endonuclease
MRKRKDSWKDLYFGTILSFLILYLIYVFVSYKKEDIGFWGSWYGFIAVLIIFISIPLIVSFVKKRYLQNIFSKTKVDPVVRNYLKNFITTFGLDRKDSKNGWIYRGYRFDWKRLEDTVIYLREHDINISVKTLGEVLNRYIDIIEKERTIRQSSFGTSSERNFSFNNLSGTDFEFLLKRLFESKGYAADMNGRPGDQGCDLIVQKEDRRIAVQAKAWKNTVGNEAVQQAVASQKMYNCSEAMVVSTSHFSREADSLAKANNVILVNKDQLIEELRIHLGEFWK